MALSRRHQANQHLRDLQQDYRCGVIAAAMYNVNGGISTETRRTPPAGKRAARPDDFFGSLAAAVPPQSERATTDNHIGAAVLAWKALFGAFRTHQTTNPVD